MSQPGAYRWDEPHLERREGRSRQSPRVAVVIPCFKVRAHILQVLSRIGPSVSRIYVVDDQCPDESGAFVEENCSDMRVRVLRHATNQGVGGATMTGYQAALEEGLDVVVKMDGDGQMDPAYLEALIAPITAGLADYAKGNRFHSPGYLTTMPWVRLVGNAALSFVNKLVSGYWNVMDPTNGYTAIDSIALRSLPFDKIDRRYFFESDMLFRLAISRAVVCDVPIPAVYGDEQSNLRVGRTLTEFPAKYLTRLVKRIIYVYFLRDFNAGTVLLLASAMFFSFGAVFGGYHWWLSIRNSQLASAGTVMLAAMPIILGFQALIGAIGIDVGSVPTQPLRWKLPLGAISTGATPTAPSVDQR